MCIGQHAVLLVTCGMATPKWSQKHSQRPAYPRLVVAGMGAQNVAPSRHLGSAAVVDAVALGSRSAGMWVTHSLITHGPKASRPATVRHIEDGVARFDHLAAA